ncbi:MAG: GNAT family N-acetyltransferase [Gammaproteobacteria bacterium]
MNISFRKANRSDVSHIVRLLSEDNIGITREKYENPLPLSYYAAFDVINADKNNLLIVAELNNQIIGTLQLTFITYLTYQGGKRALIEGVRTDQSIRGKGIGKAMIEWAIKKAKEEGCHVVQLTTDKKRPGALEFYKKLGFVASHEGLKLHL